MDLRPNMTKVRSDWPDFRNQKSIFPEKPEAKQTIFFTAELKMSSDSVVARFETLLAWLTHRPWRRGATPPADPFFAELQQLLEESLAESPVGTHSNSRNFVRLEPLTEQQKIMDLAG